MARRICTADQDRTDDGDCVDRCRAGQSRNAAGNCEWDAACPAGKVRDEGSGLCLWETLCELHQVRNDAGECVDPPCPAGEERVGVECKPLCPLDKVRNSVGECVDRLVVVPRDCPAGSVSLAGGPCIEIDLGQATDDLFACPTGQVRVSGVCKALQLERPELELDIPGGGFGPGTN